MDYHQNVFLRAGIEAAIEESDGKDEGEEEEEDSYFSDEEFADDEYAEVLNSHSFDFKFVSFHPHSFRR